MARSKRQTSTQDLAVPAPITVEAFALGDPEPVMDRRVMRDACEAWTNGRWYEPPVPFSGLAQSFDLPGPLATCIRLKVNMLARHFKPTRWLSAADFRKIALDFLSIGNCFVEEVPNLAGRPLAIRHSLARYTRRGVEPGQFFFVPAWREVHEYAPGRVHHLLQEHPAQEIYGVPEYYNALQAAMLSENATLYRRRYYLNGSHAGYVFYAAGAAISNADADKLREAMRQSKGPGNFRNLFLHAPAGKKDDIQVIPVGEQVAKDDFTAIKTVSAEEMLSAMRTPPQLVGIVPKNSSGFGDFGKADEGFYRNEIEPLWTRFEELNEMIGVPVIERTAYVPIGGAAA